MKGENIGFAPEWSQIKVRHMNDPCASRAIQYAEQWAFIMSAQLGNGNKKKFAEIAEESLRVTTEISLFDITPFQYGCVITLLHKNWQYGEQLRRWHNIRVGGADVGQKANAEGWIINPGLSI